MLYLVASVGKLGAVTGIGALLSTAIGLACAIALFLLTLSGTAMMIGWTVLFAVTAWALPQALHRDDIPNQNIVIDRVLGIWLAGAPTIPAMPLALDISLTAAIGVFVLPVLVFHVLLAWPLRQMGKSPRLWVRIGDDMIAGGIVMILSMAVLTGVLKFHGVGAPL